MCALGVCTLGVRARGRGEPRPYTNRVLLETTRVIVIERRAG